MEAIPINVIGKGGISCVPGQVCPYLEQKVVESAPEISYLYPVVTFGFIVGSVALVAYYGIRWIYEKQRSPFS